MLVFRSTSDDLVERVKLSHISFTPRYICIDNDRTMVMAWLLSSSMTPGMPAMAPSVRMSVCYDVSCVTIISQDGIPHTPGEMAAKYQRRETNREIPRINRINT